MPRRLEVHGYSLVVSSIEHERYWQGVVHVIDPHGHHGRTIETLARHATSEDAERVAATLGDDHVRNLVGLQLD